MAYRNLVIQAFHIRPNTMLTIYNIF
jgi:hypothetical protein